MKDDPVIVQRMQSFHERCAQLGLANTHQRQVIFRTLIESTIHPTPEEVYERVRRRIPSISLGTVYKNIKTFVKAGLLKEVALQHEPLRLDPNLTDHHHVVCHNCRSIADLAADDVEPVRLKGDLPDGFLIEHCEVVVLGVCKACAKKVKPERSR